MPSELRMPLVGSLASSSRLSSASLHCPQQAAAFLSSVSWTTADCRASAEVSPCATAADKLIMAAKVNVRPSRRHFCSAAASRVAFCCGIQLPPGHGSQTRVTSRQTGKGNESTCTSYLLAPGSLKGCWYGQEHLQPPKRNEPRASAAVGGT